MRGKKAPQRRIEPDPVYGSVQVTKFINYVMLDGKKSVATQVVYDALDELAKQTKQKPMEALEQSLQNLKPKIEVRARRVGGSNYQVPVPVRPERQLSLALRWLIAVARQSRGSKPISKALARELVAAYNGEGAAIKKKEDVQRMAESNRAFAQFAW